jgi:ketosteroid isomerase-like protein
VEAPSDLEAFVEEHHRALAEFVRGDPAPLRALFSQAGDVTVANPFGGIARGWDEARSRMETAAGFYRDGEVLGFDRAALVAASDMACLVEVESYRARFAGADEPTDISIRVTTVMRREDGRWRQVHRHADPLTPARPDEPYVVRST